MFLSLLAAGAQLPFNDPDFTASCILTPDALVERSDEFFCGDHPVYIQCNVTLTNQEESPPGRLWLTLKGNSHNDFPICLNCSTVSGQSTLSRMATVVDTHWAFAIWGTTQSIKVFTKGTELRPVLLFPPYTYRSRTLVMLGNYAGEKQFHLPDHDPAGLPYARYQL